MNGQGLGTGVVGADQLAFCATPAGPRTGSPAGQTEMIAQRRAGVFGAEQAAALQDRDYAR